jgi:cAMP-specific phosphodiesterase 4
MLLMLLLVSPPTPPLAPPSPSPRLLLQAADISNPTRPIAVYEKWVQGVMAEFFAQGDAEKAKGLPVSMNCDRDTVVLSKCQVGFMSFLVMPLYQSLLGYAPALRPLVDQMEANKAHYAAME